VNTNRVTAFRGEELEESQWQRVFAHYLNLALCGQVAKFLNWYHEQVPDQPNLPQQVCRELAEALYLDPAQDQAELLSVIERGRRRFEGFLNNLDPLKLPSMSLQGQVIDDLCRAVRELPQFQNKSLFFIVDEFENLLDYQQEILNTLIKHCGQDYTFKIGVRDLGWRKRSTLNPNEQLISPADYERIDIEQRLEGDQFAKFAAEVCNLRARSTPGFPSGLDFQRILPELSVAEEADKLGVQEYAAEIKGRVRSECSQWFEAAEKMPPLELYLVDAWAIAQNTSLNSVFQERQENPKTWADRVGNYSVSLLFTLRGSHRGIKKYYAGWRAYTLMAGNNIRYLLELVGQALQLHRQESEGAPGEEITAEIQTKAAVEIGRKNLHELEGLSVHGAQLTKLVLGLGLVFERLADEPVGHAPEVTQFTLPEDIPLGPSEGLLRAAVMHLALVRSVTNKRADMDLKAYDYAVHPIFSAFFNFSYRRKRKLRLTPSQLLALVQEPRATIRQILRQNNRKEDYPLPEQLRLFEGFYGAAQ